MKRAFVLLVAAAVLTPLSAGAEAFTLNPVADAGVYSYNPTGNYGSWAYGFWGFYASYCLRTLIKWDLSGVTGTISNVELSFQLYQNYPAAGKMWACKVNGDWQENAVTWANQPPHDDNAATGRMLDIDWLSGLGPHRVNCTPVAVSIVQGWRNNPATNYGLILKKNPETGDLPRCYPYMKEASNYQPVRLIVTTTTDVAPASLGRIKSLFR